MKYNSVYKILLSLLLVMTACSAPRVTPIPSMTPFPTATTTVIVTPPPLPITYTPLPLKMTTAPTIANSFPVSRPTNTLLFTPMQTATNPPFSSLHYMFPPYWVDALNGWATTEEPDSQSLLLKTDDGGFTWQDVTPPISSLYYFFLDQNNVWGVQNHSEGNAEIYHTGDGGSTWQAFPAPFSFPGIHFFDAKHGLAIAPQDLSAVPTRFKIYITTDGGQSWSRQDIAPVFTEEKVFFYIRFFQFSNGQSLSFQSPSDFWVGGGWQKANTHIAFIVSRDAGKSWKAQDILVPERLGTLSVDLPVFLNELEGFFGVHYTGSDEPYQGFFQGTLIYSTKDGGITWTRGALTYIASAHEVHFISLVDWVIESGTSLFITYDSGQNWKEQPLPLSPDGGYRSYFSDPQNGWLIIDHLGQQFFRTQDGGKTWQHFNPVVKAP